MDSLGINFPLLFMISKKALNFVTLAGLGASLVACIFSSVRCKPSLSMTCPRYSISDTMKEHLALFNLAPARSSCSKHNLHSSYDLQLCPLSLRCHLNIYRNTLARLKQGFYVPLKYRWSR